MKQKWADIPAIRALAEEIAEHLPRGKDDQERICDLIRKRLREKEEKSSSPPQGSLIPKTIEGKTEMRSVEDTEKNMLGWSFPTIEIEEHVVCAPLFFSFIEG